MLDIISVLPECYKLFFYYCKLYEATNNIKNFCITYLPMDVLINKFLLFNHKYNVKKLIQNVVCITIHYVA